MRRVVVTGHGAIAPLGVGSRRIWQRLLAGGSGLVDASSIEPRALWEGLPTTVAGVVPTDEWCPSDWVSPTDQKRLSTFAQYAIAASEMALAHASWRPSSWPDLEATGVCIGSGIGNLHELYSTSLALDKDGYKRVSPLFIPRTLINLAAGHVAMKYGLQGPNHSVTTACTTGAHSIGDASRFIAFGDADVMVAGATESCIHPLTLAGFGKLRSLSTAFNHDPSSSCRPFDKDRDGFVVAEGAAVLILEELNHAKARGADILAELAGYGCSCDAYHMTAPRQDGSGALLAMKRALKNASMRPCEVDYINAHATSTPKGDLAEARAIGTLMLGLDGVEREHQVTVSSTKGATGHLLGAAGALEAVLSVLAVCEVKKTSFRLARRNNALMIWKNAVPPTLNLHDPDVGADFNFVPLRPQDKRVNVAMSNSFGFGGTNASLIFSKCG